ncbi:UBX domain-containing protein 4-like [Branchiostoma lanceolatum]|uniref:UBX domain-containing protein 4-like n=1 Tax=Branchiostoma lanceolatum TaxID=7740 RepID=UPI0034527A18
MWEIMMKIATCCSFVKSGKVSPAGETKLDSNQGEQSEPKDMAMDRGNDDTFLVEVVQAPLSNARSSKSSSDVLKDLRQAEMIPIKSQRDSVAFEVPAVEPAAAAFESNTPPRRPVRLVRLDKKMEERRETARKKVAESHIELRDQLNKAGDRRRDILAKRSQTLANKAVRKAERKAAKKASSTTFVVTPVSDTNVIAPRESRRRRTMEARMEKKRARVAKTSTADALETRQAEAAERRQANVRATKDKARRFGRAASPVWMKASGSD